MRGWLLDIHPIGKNRVGLWIRGEKGQVYLHKVRWVPKIYVTGSLEKLVELARILAPRYEIDFVERVVKPGNDPETVLEVKVPFGRKRKLAKFILDLGDHNYFQVYDVDLPSMQEFLYEHDLYPTALIEVKGDKIKVLDSIDDLDYDLSWLKIGVLDAKIKSSNIIPSFHDQLDEVILECDGEEIILDGSEDDILEDLTGLLDGLDLDVIMTDGGDSFLIPYIHYRARVNRVKLRLGRLRDPKKLKVKYSSYFSYGRIYHKYRGIKLKGRLHIDSSNSILYQETGLEGVIEVARTARIPIQDVARYTIGSCMTSLQYYQAHRLGILLPWNPGKPIYMTAWELNKADRGGLILDARPGVYWNVGELDFKSLYPMLMLKYNISGETMNCECCRNDGFKIPELGYHVCKRWRGIVPRAIELPLKKRLRYKQLYRTTDDPELRQLYKQRSDALKWILVTAFGYLGFRKAKFGSREAHLAVCALARDTLLKAIRIAEGMGFKVIHGIVDSLWVHKNEANDEDYQELANRIEEKLGLPVSYEGRYKWIVFLPSKLNPEKPVNNRYFGVFVDGRIKYRGIEARRRDTPRIVKEMQLEMIRKLAEASDPIMLKEKALECLEIYRRYARRIILGEITVEDLAITRTLAMRPEGYSIKVRHALAAKKLEEAGLRVEPGQAVTYILTPTGAMAIQLLNNLSYESDSYVRLLERAARTVLSPFHLEGARR
ncbi:hypothetical protein DRO64_08900 [Candidatus Bathyarchaeota archaeon]|nr:MAG: hypothetical protein DRO64_08900 [Candidatus Bathyarchaeota archaeon]